MLTQPAIFNNLSKRNVCYKNDRKLLSMLMNKKNEDRIARNKTDLRVHVCML